MGKAHASHRLPNAIRAQPTHSAAVKEIACVDVGGWVCMYVCVCVCVCMCVCVYVCMYVYIYIYIYIYMDVYVLLQAIAMNKTPHTNKRQTT